jgi:hypothetical protein
MSSPVSPKLPNIENDFTIRDFVTQQLHRVAQKKDGDLDDVMPVQGEQSDARFQTAKDDRLFTKHATAARTHTTCM